MIVDVPKMLGKLGIKEFDRVRSELWACCPMPMHPEGKPSWSIVDDLTSPKHGYHKCFGCKRSGGPVNLVSTIIGITEQSAHRWLVENGCVIDDQTPDTLPGKVRCKVVEPDIGKLQLPIGVHVGKPWRELPGIIRSYLVERGISAWQVENHGIGYAVVGEQRGRIVFPVRNMYGTLIYYTGRSFTGSRLRYRSADEQPGAHPKSALFGESLWEKRPIEECYGAEGAIKVLAIERALCDIGSGVNSQAIAAFCGAELHDEQVLKLRRFERFTYFADNNETGVAFAREIEAKLCSLSAVRIIIPPEGKEADTLTRRELSALLG